MTVRVGAKLAVSESGSVVSPAKDDAENAKAEMTGGSWHVQDLMLKDESRNRKKMSGELR